LLFQLQVSLDQRGVLGIVGLARTPLETIEVGNNLVGDGFR
jgi:hypothetical protein